MCRKPLSNGGIWHIVVMGLNSDQLYIVRTIEFLLSSGQRGVREAGLDSA